MQLARRGQLSDMELRPLDYNPTLTATQLVKAGHGLVEVHVCAVGLNFKDLLNVLMPDEAAYVGGKVPLPWADFAGVVTAVPGREGIGDSRFANDDLVVGDRVFGMSGDMLRSRAVVPRAALARMPTGVTFEEAAHMPMVFMTVEYALAEQAKLRAGERILINSAAGGVGLAAIQYAKRVGAEVFASASLGKHEYLRSLGVSHISTSRDSDVFGREMRGMLGDDRVDVVLNSLTSGNYVEESVALLAPGGRFIEIGKRNIWSQERMKELRPDVVYKMHSLNELLPDEPERMVPMLENLTARVEAGDVRPLPMEVFEMRL